mgnify:CR=1 FL=1
MNLKDALSQPDGPRRTAAIVAWIQGLFNEPEQAPVLVGGAAVEILTGGAYTTGDFDFVGSVPTSVRNILEKNGFNKSGRHWIHEAAQIFLESLRAFDSVWANTEPDPSALETWANQGPRDETR